FHPSRCDVNPAPVARGACHDNSERSMPGAAGCSIQSSDVRAPVTPLTAHSICGHSARGAECTKSTPRVIAPDIAPPFRFEVRLPQRPHPAKHSRSNYSLGLFDLYDLVTTIMQ